MTIFFYLFAILLLFSALGVVLSKNPVVSVLFLIFAFCNASGIMLLLGAEFLAMMLIIIYVGAVAVLFLFVVMMLDIEFAEIKSILKRNVTGASFIVILIFADLVLISISSLKLSYMFSSPSAISKDYITNAKDILATDDELKTVISSFAHKASSSYEGSNVDMIAKVLYSDFVLEFELAGIILLVAMVACIGLTIDTKSKNLTIKQKYQDIKKQLTRNKSNSIIITKPDLGKGIKGLNYD